MLTLKQYINEQKEIENLVLEMSDESFDSLLEDLTLEEVEQLDEIIRTVGNIAKNVAMGTGRASAKVAKAVAKKAASKVTTKGRADSAERKAAKLSQKKKDLERLQKARDSIKKDREALKKLRQQGRKGGVIDSLKNKIKNAAAAVKKKHDQIKRAAQGPAAQNA